jgi:hypothetical protein
MANSIMERADDDEIMDETNKQKKWSFCILSIYIWVNI